LLGELHDPRGVALLVPLLDDPETRSIVPWWLGQIGDSVQSPPLIAALDNDDPSTRVLVIYALEALHANEAVPRLLSLVNDDRRSLVLARWSPCQRRRKRLSLSFSNISRPKLTTSDPFPG
jgi:HEAT repeat protein